MTPIAIVMMVVTFVLIWGGLVAAIISLRRSPEHPEDLRPLPDDVGEPRDRSSMTDEQSHVRRRRSGSMPV